MTEGGFVMPWTYARLAGAALAATTATLATAAPASAQALTPSPRAPAAGGSTTVACGISYPAKGFTRLTNFPANTVTLRSGPSNSCIQTGQGTHDQLAQYLCYTPGDGGTWTFLRNASTGDQGWVRDDLLGGDGSQVACDPNPPAAGVSLIRMPTDAVSQLMDLAGLDGNTAQAGAPPKATPFGLDRLLNALFG